MRPLALAVLVAAIAAAPAARADDDSVDAVDRSVDTALREGPYTFCKTPHKPLFGRQRDLCVLATEIDACDGFAAACKSPLEDPAPAEKPREQGSWLAALAPIARLLLYLLVVAITVAIAIPVVRAILRARRNKRLADPVPHARPTVAAPVAAPPVEIEAIDDAEAALRLADEHRRRGDFARALALYLGASLSALDRRGAIRIAKHRTNGEYVRFCVEEPARPPLREIVREVDRMTFGKIPPTADVLERVAARAASIVQRSVTTTLVVLALVLAASACGGDRPHGHDDPAGDELPIDVLKRHGFDITPLGQSLASIPARGDSQSDETPGGGEVIVVDVDRVPLGDADTRAHLVRWVEGGGVLVLFGDPGGWPEELHAARVATSGMRDIVLEERTPEPSTHDDDDDDDPDDAPNDPVGTIRGRVAQPRAVKLEGAAPLARIGGDPYVVWKPLGHGVVLGVANDDLFTNVGILPKHNAAILVEVIRLATEHAHVRHAASAGSPSGKGKEHVRVRHAKREDAIPPPSTPFAALLAAGLGKGTWHALAAAIVLFLAFGIRHARARSQRSSPRRAFAEHVEATGAFWGRAKALPHALGAYGRFVEMRLRERVPRGADPVAFLASRANADAEHVARVYERALRAKDDDPIRGDELETIKELRTLLVKALG